ncbi:hypothetical protein HPP92_028716 [Vanilla planifolia]|uniref:Uncharacterized protein n=1 Tax=Vanilla planifolia TaxID=51239 RepID=A0A835U2S0_VANPL|nr:hypothetical protein HPP92_028716 [Vanilla planifolia]KAG0446708.1 hypothetical protein HPP92_028699 [Vanilla planifolia]
MTGSKTTAERPGRRLHRRGQLGAGSCLRLGNDLGLLRRWNRVGAVYGSKTALDNNNSRADTREESKRPHDDRGESKLPYGF